jgi:Flp pilus assembly pilin Flp
MLERFTKRICRLYGEAGQGLVEYAMILSLVAIVSASVLTVLGLDVRDLLNSVEAGINGDAANS